MRSLIIYFFLIPSIVAVDFNKDIKPILSRNCFSCHGKEKQKGDLRLDERNFAQNVIKPDKTGKYPFLNKIFHNDPEEIMPPPEEGSLSNNEKELLKKWILEGAPYEKHWSFIPLSKIAVPSIKDKWISNDIDKFILSKLKDYDLKPNPVIFDYKLLKRISHLINGLPPSDKTYEKFKKGELNYNDYLVELMNSTAYGEHLASTWLDSARYGDTNGMQYDNSRPIWPYRDWVINALNQNMPYDQFLTEQIAGDLLPQSGMSQKIATGFLRCNVTTNEMGVLEEEFQVRNAKDRLNTTMLTFTGLTFNCAECHDHKYDPLSQKEYYQLLAYFNNLDGRAVGGPYELANEPVIPVLSEDKNKLFKELNLKSDALVKKMRGIKKESADAFWWWHYQTMASPPKVIYLMGQLESFFPFEEKEGTVTLNLINEELCNVKGIPFRSKGKYGNGLLFNSRSYVISQTAGKFSRNNEMTLGFWIKPEKGNKGTVIGRFDSIIQKGWKLSIDSGSISFQMSSSKIKGLLIESREKIPTNKWSHIALSYDGKSKAAGSKIFINGKPAQLDIVLDSLDGDIELNSDMLIGIENREGWLVYSSLDEVFTAKKLLSDNEIREISKFKSASRLALIPPDKLTPALKAELHDYYLKFHHKEYSAVYKEFLKLEDHKQEIMNTSDITMIMKEKSSPVSTYILVGGDYERKAEKVDRKLPSFLNINEQEFPKNRLGIAKWLTDKQHPLTARVIANRIWQHLLGYGLVRTPEDFGIQGEFPSHPELLDHLANYLIQNNWDLKKLILYITSSSTFKQNSVTTNAKKTKDPENRLFSHFQRRRLQAEAIRDQALFVSGLLENTVGGTPVYPYQPEGLWESVTFDISNTHSFIQSNGKENYRKSIYSFWKRNLPPPAMTIFDAPYRQECIIRRNSSNTPQQALVLLNDPQFTETYDQLSKSLKSKKLKQSKLVEVLFQKLYRRVPDPEEMQLSLDLIDGSGLHVLIHSLMNTDEFISIE